MYSDEIGRFLQIDPIGYHEGPNLYTYVFNNCINLQDPFGKHSYQECVAENPILQPENIAQCGAYVSLCISAPCPYNPVCWIAASCTAAIAAADAYCAWHGHEEPPYEPIICTLMSQGEIYVTGYGSQGGSQYDRDCKYDCPEPHEDIETIARAASESSCICPKTAESDDYGYTNYVD